MAMASRSSERGEGKDELGHSRGAATRTQRYDSKFDPVPRNRGFRHKLGTWGPGATPNIAELVVR
jgi:hypothetical protein